MLNAGSMFILLGVLAEAQAASGPCATSVALVKALVRLVEGPQICDPGSVT